MIPYVAYKFITIVVATPPLHDIHYIGIHALSLHILHASKCRCHKTPSVDCSVCVLLPSPLGISPSDTPHLPFHYTRYRHRFQGMRMEGLEGDVFARRWYGIWRTPEPRPFNAILVWTVVAGRRNRSWPSWLALWRCTRSGAWCVPRLFDAISKCAQGLFKMGTYRIVAGRTVAVPLLRLQVLGTQRRRKCRSAIFHSYLWRPRWPRWYEWAIVLDLWWTRRSPRFIGC